MQNLVGVPKQKALRLLILKAFAKFATLSSGPDGTRTRDLRRDRAAF